MIGYALLVLIAFFTTVVGFIVVGVAFWGWGQEKKAKLAADKAAHLASIEDSELKFPAL